MFLLPMLVACSSADYSLDEADTAGFNDLDDGAEAPSDGTSSGTTAPPEQEDDFLALAPAATDAYVFVANPDRGTVTRITVPGLQVETRPVGTDPVAVATTADYQRAITLNVGSDDVSIIDAAAFTVRTVAIRENMNRISLAPDGVWAMAWYDPDADQEGQNDGVHSFNEVSFVNLVTGEHAPLAVGFNPHGVQWTPDGRLALVISDGTLAVVNLTTGSLEPHLIDIAADPLDAPPAEEVVLTPDGAYAFVRQFGANDVLCVSLADWTVDAFPAGANPTDLDLSPDGAHITVVARGSRQLLNWHTADPYGDPDVVALPGDSAYGSVLYAGDGAQAVLYTNATATPRYGLWDTTSGTILERTLVKPIASVGLSPTGGSLIVFHTKTDAADAAADSPFNGRWAITLVDMADQRQNPMVLAAEPSGYATSDDGRFGYFIMDGQPWLETLVFDTLLYEEVALKSAPVFVGALPGTDTAWASQEYDLGRISFYDADSGTLDTVTGFELNAEIDHEE